MTTPIRAATADEMDDLLALMREAEYEQYLFPISEERARAMLTRAFEGRGGVACVIGAKGRIEAAMYLLIDQPLYSDVWLFSEVFNYVRPAFRRTNHARDLIAEAKRWALNTDKANGGVPLIMGVLSNERTEAKVRLYRRQLQNPVGAVFVFNSNWDRPAPIYQSPYGNEDWVELRRAVGAR